MWDSISLPKLDHKQCQQTELKTILSLLDIKRMELLNTRPRESLWSTVEGVKYSGGWGIVWGIPSVLWKDTIRTVQDRHQFCREIPSIHGEKPQALWR